jgi:hypothetical protein
MSPKTRGLSNCQFADSADAMVVTLQMNRDLDHRYCKEQLSNPPDADDQKGG